MLLPLQGLAGDIDDFRLWTRAIADHGLGRAYDQTVSFPAVMPWIWWLLGSLAPAVRSTVPDDATALALMKLPATLADLGIAALVGWSLRERSVVAVVAALAILLHPAVIYVSGLWGQYESLYVLPLLGAWPLLRGGRPGWAAVLIAVGLMTKPQALPLLVPFAAWYLRREGLAGSLRAAVTGAVTVVLLWAPFLAASGPANYLDNLASYTSQFAVLSLRAWNPWWILQSLAGGNDFIADTSPIAGPVTLRWIGAGLALIGELVVFAWVWRRPTATGLAWGLAAASLVAFCALTTMHERYAYAALVFLLLAWPNPLAVGTWVLASVAITLNLLAAVPPNGPPGSLVPIGGAVGIAGSVAMSTVLATTLVGLRRATREPPQLEPVNPWASGV